MLAGALALGGSAGAIRPEGFKPVEGETDLGFLYLVGDHDKPLDQREFVTIREPKYAAVRNTSLSDDEEVLGLATAGNSYCFPVRQMTYHHIADVYIGGTRNTVTYCAMANSVVMFQQQETIGGYPAKLHLQVGGSFSGTLVLSQNFLLNDLGMQTWDMFPQLNPQFPIPNQVGRSTPRIGPPLSITTYGLWRRKYPETLVLQPNPRFADKYAEYDAKPKGYSILKERDRTIKMQDKRLSPGREVYGVAIGQESSAWSIEEVEHRKQIFVPMAGDVIHIAWDQELKTPVVVNPPEGIIATRCYWYSWSSFYPGGPLNGKFAVEGDIAAIPKEEEEPTVQVSNADESHSTGSSTK
jgi:hypothetical protein